MCKGYWGLAKSGELQLTFSKPSSLLVIVWWWQGFCPFISFLIFSPPTSINCWTTFYFLLRASYSDGKIKAPPKPCAGNQGTQIMVGWLVVLPLFPGLYIYTTYCYVLHCKVYTASFRIFLKCFFCVPWLHSCFSIYLHLKQFSWRIQCYLQWKNCNFQWKADVYGVMALV